MSLRILYQVNEGPPREAHSFTRNWLQALRSVLGAKQVTMIDTGGTSRTIGYAGSKSLADFLNGVVVIGSPNGIVPGSSSTPATYEDTALGSVIPHDPDHGLYYELQVIAEREGGPAYYQSKRTRTFWNFTGAPLTVREFGIVLRIPDTTGTNRYFLVFHEIVPDTIVGGGTHVWPPGPGQTLTIGLTMRVDT